jgi:hypothetical protein
MMDVIRSLYKISPATTENWLFFETYRILCANQGPAREGGGVQQAQSQSPVAKPIPRGLGNRAFG